MNLIFRTVWNRTLGRLVVASEAARSQGKAGGQCLQATLVSAVKIAPASALRPLVIAAGLVGAGAVGSAAIAQDATYDYLEVNNDLTVSGDAILSALQVSGDASFDGALSVDGVSVATANDITGISTNETAITTLDGRVGATEGDISDLTGRVDTTEGDISDLTGRVDTTEGDISDLTGRVGTNEGNITALVGRVDTNTADITTINTALNDLGVDADNPGVKYFRAKSSGPDADASGVDSVAIGPNAKSQGANSLAAGNGAQAKDENSVALGNEAIAEGKNNLAVGNGATVDNALATKSTAIGSGATVSGNTTDSAIAFGTAAKATGAAATAIGQNANAGAEGTAIGKNAEAGGSAIAMGPNAKATAGNSLALGNGAQSATEGSIALGTAAGKGTVATPPSPGLDETHHIAIGTNAGQNIVGNQTTSIGYGAGSGSEGNYNIAIGNLAGRNIDGNNNISIGDQANIDRKKSTTHAVALGGNTVAYSRATALGDEAKAEGTHSVALGYQAKTTDIGSSVSGGGVAIGANAQARGSSVALGQNSVTESSTGKGFITGWNGGGNDINVVSVGSTAGLTRRIINVADGSKDTDAVNVNQLRGTQQNLADILGNGELSAEGKVSSFEVGGEKYTSVAEALVAAGVPGTGGVIDTAGAVVYEAGSSKSRVILEGVDGTTIKNVAAGTEERDAVNFGQMNTAIDEGKVKYFSVNSDQVNNKDNSGATAADAIAIGPDASATALASIAIGRDTSTLSSAENSIAMGQHIIVEQEHSVGIGNDVHAYGASNVAIGDGTKSTGANSIAIGTGAASDRKLPTESPSVDNAISIGTKSHVTADDGIAMGRDSVSSAERGMAYGQEAKARGIDSIATGTRAVALGERSMATGLEATASATDSTATGTRAKARGIQSQALGFEAKTYAKDGIALGSNSVSGIEDTVTNADPSLKAFNNNTIAIGNSAQATYQGATATGTRAQATAQDAMASGTDAKATAQNASASGTSAEATAEGAMASGTGAKAIAKNAMASGTGAQAKTESAIALGTKAGDAGTGVNSISTGNNASAQGLNSIASGTDARAYLEGSVALGRGAQAGQGIAQDGSKAVALGDGSGAFANNSVALGAGSNTNNSYTTSTAAYSKIENNDATSGVVSVGKTGAERRILNVAGGEADTDGVNVAQLKAADKLLTERGMDFAGNDSSVIHKNLGEQLNIVGGMTDLTPAAASAQNLRTVKNAAGDLEIQMSETPQFGDVVINDGDSGKITGVTAGTEGDHAVNLDQLTDVETVANKGWNLSAQDAAAQNVAPGGEVNLRNSDGNINVTQETKDGREEVTFALSDDVNLGGDLTVEGETKLGDKFVVNNDNTVTYDGQEIANQGDGLSFAGNTGSDIDKTLGDTTPLTISGQLAASEATTGANLRVDSDGDKLNLVMAKNLTDLDSVTINDGGPTINSSGIDMGAPEEDGQPTNKIINLAPGEDGTDAVNVDQLTDVETIANAGWNVRTTDTDAAGSSNVAPEANVDFVSSDDNVVVKHTRDVDGNTSIDYALSDDVHLGGDLTVEGVTQLGDNFTINKDGTTNYDVTIDNTTGGNSLVNKKYITQVTGDIETKGLNFAGNDYDATDSSSVIHKDLGEQLNIVGGMTDMDDDAASSTNLRTIKNANGDLEIQMAKTLSDLDEVIVGENGAPGRPGEDGYNGKPGVGINGEDGSIGLTGPAGADGTPGANGTISVTNGVAGVAGVDGKDGITRIVIDDIEVATMEDGLIFTGNDNTAGDVERKLNQTLSIEGAATSPGDYSGANLKTVTDPTSGAIKLELAKNLTDLDSITINNGGPVINKDGIDMGAPEEDGQPTNKITNLAPGVDGTDGVNVDQLKDLDISLTNKGLNFAGNTGSGFNTPLGETVNIVGRMQSTDSGAASGRNIRTVAKDNGELVIQMSRNLTDLDSATFGNGDDLFTINKDGVQFVDAAGEQRDGTPSIAADGIDGGGNQVTGVGSGLGGQNLGDVIGDDLNNAVNVGDLQATSSAEQGGGFGLADASGGTVMKDLGETIKVVDPDNNIITTADNANGELQLSLSNDLAVGGPGKDGEPGKDGYIGVDGADGTTGVGIDGKDGKITITSSDGIPGEDGIDGMAGSSADIFVKKGAPGVNGVDGETTTRIVYTDPEGNPQEVATLEDGLKFEGNQGDTIAKQLNETLTVKGELDNADDASGANLRVDSADGKLNLVMAKNLTDLDSATFGNGDDLFTINKGGVQFVNSAGDQRDNTPSITETGIDGGDNQITGVGSGLGGQDLGDVSGDDLNNAANIGDLQSTSGELTKKGLDFAGNRGDVHKDLGDMLTIRGGMTDMSGKAASGKNIRTVVSKDGEMVVQMSRNLIDLDSITINDGGPVISGSGIDMGGLNDEGEPTNKITNLAKGEVSETSTDGINGSQLWTVQETAKAGWNLTTNGEASSLSNVAPRDTVDFSDDGNVLVSNTGNNVSVALADSITLGEGDTAVTVDGEEGRITVGDTIMDGEGLKIANGGPSVTINGIYAGNQQITGVASGLGGQQLDQISGDDLMNAVNVGDLQTVAGDIGKDVAAAKTVVTPGKNIEVTESTGENGESVYEVATSAEVEFDKMEVGSVTIDKDNVDDEGNTIIAGVGKGDVSADSTDAVNGSQLHQVKNDIGDINTSLDGGLDFAADEGDAVNRKLGDTVGITGDDNITTRTSDDGVQVTLNRDLAVDSVTTGRTTINDNGVSIEGGPSMTVDGIDGGGKRITNVAPGVDATDAANVGQLQELNQNFYNEMGNVHNRIDDLEDNAYAGVASAIAAASVPQTVHSGESMFAVGAGTYKGESAVSVGVSRLSDNGRMAIKLNVTGDSQGNFGAGVGAGWHW